MSEREQMAAIERDAEDFANYVREVITSELVGKGGGDILIDDEPGSFLWVDVEGQCLWRISVEGVKAVTP